MGSFSNLCYFVVPCCPLTHFQLYSLALSDLFPLRGAIEPRRFGKQQSPLRPTRDDLFSESLRTACTRCTRRLKQQSGADAPSASKPSATNYVWYMEKIMWPCSGVGVVRTRSLVVTGLGLDGYDLHSSPGM